MTTRFFKHPRAIERFRCGPLAGHIDQFAELLFELGYNRVYARNKLWLLRDLDRWLDRHGLRASQLDETRLAEFARNRARQRRRLKPGSGPMLEKFLAYLRNSGVVAARASILSREARRAEQGWCWVLLRANYEKQISEKGGKAFRWGTIDWSVDSLRKATEKTMPCRKAMVDA